MKTKICFESRVTKDTAYGRVFDYGQCKNEMTLIQLIKNSKYCIEWAVINPKDNEIIDYVEIGITIKNKKIVDYDGVFELPKEAIQLLKNNGFETEERT